MWAKSGVRTWQDVYSSLGGARSDNSKEKTSCSRIYSGQNGKMRAFQAEEIEKKNTTMLKKAQLRVGKAVPKGMRYRDGMKPKKQRHRKPKIEDNHKRTGSTNRDKCLKGTPTGYLLFLKVFLFRPSAAGVLTRGGELDCRSWWANRKLGSGDKNTEHSLEKSDWKKERASSSNWMGDI